MMQLYKVTDYLEIWGLSDGYNYYKFFPKKLIDDNFIDSEIYEKIISPYLGKNQDLLNYIVDYFFDIDERSRKKFRTEI